MGSILVDGREVQCDAVVRADKRYKFTALPKRTETRAILYHWTGGRGLGPQVHRTLQERGLSVHFNIDPNGDVWQYADCALRCSHAGVANGWSVGVEMTNAAGPALIQGDAPRAVVVENIHGKDVRHTTFTAAQVHSAIELGQSVCTAYGLPLVVPLDETGDVFSTVLPTAVRDHWRGILGHLHVSDAKRDCGLSLLRAFAALATREMNGLVGPAQ
jgi:hypothetical protein